MKNKFIINISNISKKTFRNLAILTFIIGVALQAYNYQTFKKYNWSLVKQKVDLTKSINQRFELSPNFDKDNNTQFEIILFYKKVIPAAGAILDNSLTMQVIVSEQASENTLWQHQHTPSKDFTVTRKGTEVVLGKFKLDNSKKYNLDLEVKTPTALKGKDIVLSVVSNQQLFRDNFKIAGVVELFSYSLFIVSFLLFIGFIIAPSGHKKS